MVSLPPFSQLQKQRAVTVTDDSFWREIMAPFESGLLKQSKLEVMHYHKDRRSNRFPS